MSLSNPTPTNPAQHFFQWAGSTGKLQWYDKEKKVNVETRLPFEFIVLDQLATITGYNKTTESGFWSNEVRSTKKDELYVRTKAGPFEAGLYENLTQTAKRGGKFAASIYIAHKIGDEWVIGNIKAHGSALSAWIEFTKANRGATTSSKISMSRGEVQEAPTGEFYPPVFTAEPWEEDEYKAALELDKQLQIYLSQYLAAPKFDDDTVSNSLSAETPIADQYNKEDLPVSSQKEEMTLDDFGGEPIDLSNIPF